MKISSKSSTVGLLQSVSEQKKKGKNEEGKKDKETKKIL
jgi:hypothetical protein